jgi:hypothetical protein
MHVCMYVYAYVRDAYLLNVVNFKVLCMYACIYACIYVYIRDIYFCSVVSFKVVCMYVCMHVCMSMYMYVTHIRQM